MATISSFHIRKFKGAASVDIYFSNRISTPIITLIGLNESGKTTILEAISYFISGDTSVSSLFEGTTPPGVETLIPLNQKAAFTGNVDIGANFALSKDDIDTLIASADANGFDIDRGSITERASMTRSFRFKDSDPSKPYNGWTLSFSAKKKKARKYTLCDNKGLITEAREGVLFDLWLSSRTER